MLALKVLPAERPAQMAWPKRQNPGVARLFNQRLSIEFCEQMAAAGFEMTLLDLHWDRYVFYRPGDAEAPTS